MSKNMMADRIAKPHMKIMFGLHEGWRFEVCNFMLCDRDLFFLAAEYAALHNPDFYMSRALASRAFWSVENISHELG